LNQRLTRDAQFEIRKYAEGIYNLMQEDLQQIGINYEKL